MRRCGLAHKVPRVFRDAAGLWADWAGSIRGEKGVPARIKTFGHSRRKRQGIGDPRRGRRPARVGQLEAASHAALGQGEEGAADVLTQYRSGRADALHFQPSARVRMARRTCSGRFGQASIRRVNSGANWGWPKQTVSKPRVAPAASVGATVVWKA
jgi:hypothetical protein